MSGRSRRDRKLRVEKSTLRTLDRTDLDKVAGGAGKQDGDLGLDPRWISRGRGTV